MIFEGGEARLSEAQISQAAEEVGLRFPESLRDVFRQTNGGSPTRYVYTDGKIDTAVNQCLPIYGKGSLSAITIYENLALRRKLIPLHLFPFAIDAGGNLFLADCSTPEGWVYFWEHDLGVPGPNPTPLAVDIPTFWSRMKEDLDDNGNPTVAIPPGTRLQ